MTVEKFDNANSVVQHAIGKRAMDRRSGGGRNRGVDGTICGGGSWFSRRDKQGQLASSSWEVAMVRMRNWINRDNAFMGYADDEEESYDGYVGRKDGGSSYSRRSRGRSRGRYKDDPPPVYKDGGDGYGDGDDGYDEDEYNSGYDRHNGRNDGQDIRQRRDKHRRDRYNDGNLKHKSTQRESIREEDHSPKE